MTDKLDTEIIVNIIKHGQESFQKTWIELMEEIFMETLN